MLRVRLHVTQKAGRRSHELPSKAVGGRHAHSLEINKIQTEDTAAQMDVHGLFVMVMVMIVSLVMMMLRTMVTLRTHRRKRRFFATLVAKARCCARHHALLYVYSVDCTAHRHGTDINPAVICTTCYPQSFRAPDTLAKTVRKNGVARYIRAAAVSLTKSLQELLRSAMCISEWWLAPVTEKTVATNALESIDKYGW